MSMLREGNTAIRAEVSPFVRRREWPHGRFTKLHGPPALSLDERGMIRDCTASCEEFFGYQRQDLLDHHISSLFPQLEGVALVEDGQFNPLLNFICRCGQLFHAQSREGDTFPCNLIFVSLENNGKRTLRMIVSPASPNHQSREQTEH